MARRVVGVLRRLALAAVLGVAAIALLLRRDGFEALDGILVLVLALPLRVLTPAFLGLSALSALLCVALAGAGVVALVVLAVA